MPDTEHTNECHRDQRASLWSAKIHILSAPRVELSRMRQRFMLRRTASECVKLRLHGVHHLCAHAANTVFNTAPIMARN